MKVIIKKAVEIESISLSPTQKLILPDDVGQQLIDNGDADKLPDNEPGGFVVFSRDRKAD